MGENQGDQVGTENPFHKNVKKIQTNSLKKICFKQLQTT